MWYAFCAFVLLVMYKFYDLMIKPKPAFVTTQKSSNAYPVKTFEQDEAFVNTVIAIRKASNEADLKQAIKKIQSFEKNCRNSDSGESDLNKLIELWQAAESKLSLTK
jgi:7,8-dihydro-6-hydroxymethylpterin-pyrophosphokinase